MERHRLTLRVMPGIYAICRLAAGSPLPDWATTAPVFSVTRTADEVSVICLEGDAPADVTRDGGWRMLQAAGPFPLTMTGVLHSLTAPLASAGVPLFAMSTFDTDYLLIRAGDLRRAAEALREAGHSVEGSAD